MNILRRIILERKLRINVQIVTRSLRREFCIFGRWQGDILDHAALGVFPSQFVHLRQIICQSQVIYVTHSRNY